ncbi:ATP-binding protein [Streptomyces pseudogriseolus]|uniref:ATP-binding protein n=1 Tax=Streptomyces pseudogriseolus TaxID=36817 RepID=UPI003FA1ACFA
MPEIPVVPAHWHFPAHPASVRRARHAVTETLPHALRPLLGDDLSLLTSELVTNAIRYGACREDEDLIELVLWPADGHYWLAVSDPGAGTGTGKPALSHLDAASENGRGLLLVDSLATAWTVRPRPARGTSVIAGLSLRQGARPAGAVGRPGPTARPCPHCLTG